MANKNFKVKNSITIPTPLPLTEGGTGQTSATNALNSLLPSQVDNSGKYLKTDGSTVSWNTISGGGYTQIATGTLSSGTSITISNIPTTYKNLVLVFNNIDVSANTDFTLSATRYTGRALYTGTTVYQSTYNAGGVTWGNNQTSIKLNWTGGAVQHSTGYYFNSLITFPQYADPSSQDARFFTVQSNWNNGGYPSFTQLNGNLTSTFADPRQITELVFATSGATFNDGTYILYGVK